MSKILALGTGPLLAGDVRNFSAHCLRTLHLVRPLIDAGHEVSLYTLPISSDRPESQLNHGVEEKDHDGFAYRAFLNCDDTYNLKQLDEACKSLRPDCLLGINSYPCAMLSQVQCIAPLWADLNGSVIIEGQIKSAIYGNNSLLGHYWTIEEWPLRRADKFSTVSMRQFYALHGELSAVGRMNRHTFDYPFAHHIPNAYNPFFADRSNRRLGKRTIRGELVPSDAFILLWSGGYNSWMDGAGLLSAVEKAMEACPDLHYVSTGGPIHGHDDLTYSKFQQMVQESSFRDRFHLLGWIEANEIPSLYAQADLGLCVDAKNYETMFGARNRTVNMLASGLAVLTCRGAEISEELIDAGCALGCSLNDPEDLAQRMIEAYGDRDLLRRIGAKGRDYVLEHFTYERTTQELVEWAAHPCFAPDNEVKIQRGASGSNPFFIPSNPIEERRARLDAPQPSANGSPSPPSTTIKQWVRRFLGRQRYDKLRFLRRQWLPEYWPRYLNRRKELRAGNPGNLEDLYVFLTNVSGQLSLEDYRRLAPTMPRLDRLILTGGEPVLHPDCREITQLLAQHTQARRVTLMSSGTAPAELESICATILEEGIPGVLDVVISLDGLEETHNCIRGNPDAWHLANYSLGLLTHLKARNPGRFDLGVFTIISDKNHKEIEALNSHIERNFGCRHDFEFIRGSSFSVWNLPDEVRAQYDGAGSSLPPQDAWDEILETLQRISRRSGIANHADHLTSLFTVQMLRTGKKMVECVSAGQNVGVLYGNGEVAHCEFSKPFGSIRDHAMDFGQTWTSKEADEMRDRLHGCHCTHGCYLSKNIEYSLRGQLAMLTRL